MMDSIPDGMGNSLSPEPCALIPVAVTPSMTVTGGADRAPFGSAISPSWMNR